MHYLPAPSRARTASLSLPPLIKGALLRGGGRERKQPACVCARAVQNAPPAHSVRTLSHPPLSQGFHCEVVGGGRIKRDDVAKTILIYGYSYGFGRAPHTISAALARKAYPTYKVDWSNDGY